MSFPKTGQWRAIKENNWYFAVDFEDKKRQGPFENRKEADEFVDAANSTLADEGFDFLPDNMEAED